MNNMSPWDLESYPAEVSPVQEFAQTLSAVPLYDPLAPALLAELKQEGRELVTRLIDPPISPVQDVNTCKNKHSDVKDSISYPFTSFKSQTFENLTDRETYHKLRGLLCVPP